MSLFSGTKVAGKGDEQAGTGSATTAYGAKRSSTGPASFTPASQQNHRLRTDEAGEFNLQFFEPPAVHTTSRAMPTERGAVSTKPNWA